MPCAVEEFDVPLGAITSGQADGFHLDTHRFVYGVSAHLEYVVVDNQSDATVTLLQYHRLPTILPGERKHVALPKGTRDIFAQVNATVTAGQVVLTVGICREGM